jgi:hypothetical protein
VTTPAFINSPHRVLCEAYFEAGLVELGQEPNSEDLARGMNRLNDLLNLLQTQGLKLWLQFDLAIPLVQGVNLYLIGPAALGGTVIMTRPTRILEGYYRDNNNVDRPLLVLSRNDWNTLSLKVPGVPAQEGSVNSYFVDKQVNTMNLYTWLTPDAVAATGTVHATIQQQQPNPVGLTDTLVFGPEWFIGLIWLMADQLSQGQPIAVQAKCKANAEQYREMLEDWDVEDASTVFQPDPRTQYIANRFV